MRDPEHLQVRNFSKLHVFRLSPFKAFAIDLHGAVQDTWVARFEFRALRSAVERPARSNPSRDDQRGLRMGMNAMFIGETTGWSAKLTAVQHIARACQT